MRLEGQCSCERLPERRAAATLQVFAPQQPRRETDAAGHRRRQGRGRGQGGALELVASLPVRPLRLRCEVSAWRRLLSLFRWQTCFAADAEREREDEKEKNMKRKGEREGEGGERERAWSQR